MGSLCPLQKMQMVYFFTVGKSLVIISSVRRMIVVILKVLFLCYWDEETVEINLKGVKIPHFNISDLISDAVRARKNFNPIGSR